MPLHLLKLSVGSESIKDLEEWIARRVAERAGRGESRQHTHVTRMVPKRQDELLGGGSMYWVIKGQVAARQTLVDVQPFTDADGIGRCRIVMEPRLVPVRPRPCRPFQGWRYLPDADVPADADWGNSGPVAMPEQLRRELAHLGLL